MDDTSAPAASGRVVAAERGLAWWTEAWALFVRAAGMWVVLGILLFLILLVISLVPLLGALVSTLLVPPFVASWMLAVRKLQGGGALELADLFTAFRGDKLVPLVVQGALLLAAVVVITLVAVVFGLGAVFGVAVGGAQQSVGGVLAAMGAGMLALALMFVLGVLAAMALWFGPALVVFRGTAPLDAMRVSFSACLRNIVPFVVYGVVYIVASIVASIPFGLGWLVLAPLTMISVYGSYEDVFGA
jgi:hypothetical protein